MTSRTFTRRQYESDVTISSSSRPHGVIAALSLRRGRSSATKTLVADVAPPALHNTNLNPLVDGPMVQLVAIHGKVRRSGYLKQLP